MHSVKDLLVRRNAVLESIADQGARQSGWREWLAERLPEELRARITGVVEREATLVVFADSPGWSVRLRYALADLEADLRKENAALTRFVVRVMPAASA